ncbi:hypothetical protein Gohar_015639 [Gossypium harknessii]|uniref:Uncharacterized protein n=1 Tax=Gossypium harknessii TaxID=34285 RepID=A0A7J9G2K5_9ROSI|nr:hypothetical protein [Gossypium harknessii]
MLVKFVDMVPKMYCMCLGIALRLGTFGTSSFQQISSLDFILDPFMSG